MKALSFLLGAIAVLSLGLSQACLADDAAPPAGDPATPVASHDDGFAARLNDQLARISKRIGTLNEQGFVDSNELQGLMAKQKELKGALAMAKADGTISKDERAKLEQMRKDLASAAFLDGHGANDFSMVAQRMQARIDQGKAKGCLTDGEGADLQKQLDTFKTSLAGAGAGELTADTAKALAAQRRQLSQDIVADQLNGTGQVCPRENRDNDNIDERQANQAGRIERCLAAGKMTDEQHQNFLDQQTSIRKKEAEYLADGSLTKDEKADLEQLLDQASTALQLQCDPLKAHPDNAASGAASGGSAL